MNEYVPGCPFCVGESLHVGSEVVVENKTKVMRYRVICDNCGARGSSHTTPKAAVNMWVASLYSMSMNLRTVQISLVPKEKTE